MVSIMRISSRSLLKSRLFIKHCQIAHISEQERNLIGNREIVGFGMNGQPVYVDAHDYPFPAIRWKETTTELQALHEKEKCDWNELSCEDKKALYRASFCQTFSEFQATSLGEWKYVIGSLLMIISPAFWLFYYFKATIYSGKLPESFEEERRACQFRRMLDLKMNPIQGLASKWDYEKDDWKDPRDPWKPKPKSK
ncbi:cytochrome c oxidase subunit 4 isoform 1, mitochondrial [Dendroctonus ponderosae]|uniref:Cytochrome c oxidase subunit 4 n=1 Tax=Dendroctonus ponderosae TaxID=77166 RepID=U4UBD5_DENPD|nr:cytochrome c oxidase subunit 4 isoform 1, mitochondrial [Dendroctonus ponderosae]ERL90347.1 hypothetical protein D910_07696 [Dendroctonus ponderosae]KAH1010253.1 hypothetical protein HUJ05_004572 [Dendroctonus ponderosae]